MQRFKRGVFQSWPSFITVMPHLADGNALYHHVYFNSGMDKNGYPVYEFISESSYFTNERQIDCHHSYNSMSFTLIHRQIVIRFCVEGKDSSWRFCKETDTIVSKPGNDQRSPLGSWGDDEFIVEGNGLLVIGKETLWSKKNSNNLCFAL